ncbi:MAG: hypothetical protein MUC49_15850 [Raineya sp.]|jgi:hypothetical protein|nr:hypothetical protein [Raineya sp.]
MNLVVYRQTSGLNPFQLSIVHASDAKTIKELSKPEMAMFSNKLVSKTLLLLGHNKMLQNPQERQFFEEALELQLLSKAYNFTTKEVETAIELAICGDVENDVTPTMEFLSIPGIIKAIASYKKYKSEVTQKLWKEQEKEKEKQEDILREQNRIKFLKELFEYCLKCVQDKIECEYFVPNLYTRNVVTSLSKYITDNNLYEIPVETKWKILLEERKKVFKAITQVDIADMPDKYAVFAEKYQKKCHIDNNYFFVISLDNARIRVFKEFIEYLVKHFKGKKFDTQKSLILEAIDNIPPFSAL